MTTALAIQAALTQASWLGFRLMIGYWAVAEGADGAMLGLIAAAFAAPAVVMAMPAGRWSDRVGGPVLVLGGIAVAATGVSVLLLTNGLWPLPLGAALLGLGHLFIMIGQQSFVAHHAEEGKRDSAFGTMTAAASTGQLIGPLVITGVAAAAATPMSGNGVNSAAGVVASSIFALSALPFALWLLLRSGKHQNRGAGDRRGSGLGLLKAPGMGRSIAVSAAILVTVDLIYAFIPAWAIEHGVSVTAVGWLLALRAAVSIVSRIGLTRLVESFGRALLLRISITCGAVGLAILPFVDASGAIPVMVLLGLALGIPQPLTMSWVVSLVPAAVHGQALGLRVSANRLAQICIPPVVGAAAGPFGVTAIFLANSMVLSTSLLAVRSRDDDGRG